MGLEEQKEKVWIKRKEKCMRKYPDLKEIFFDLVYYFFSLFTPYIDAGALN